MALLRRGHRCKPVSLDPYTGVGFSLCLKGPCTQIVDTLAPKYPNRDYFKGNLYTWTLRDSVYGGPGPSLLPQHFFAKPTSLKAQTI